jgi:hypothetical protein
LLGKEPGGTCEGKGIEKKKEKVEKKNRMKVRPNELNTPEM